MEGTRSINCHFFSYCGTRLGSSFHLQLLNSKRPPYCVHFLLDPSVFSFVTQSGSCYTRKCAATRVKTFQAPNKIKFFSHCSLFECPKEKKKTGVKITEKRSLCRFERNRAWKRNELSHRHKFSVYEFY